MDEKEIDSTLSKLEVDTNLDSYQRAVIIILRKINAKLDSNTDILTSHIRDENDLVEAWKNAKGAAKFLVIIIAGLSALGTAYQWLITHFNVTIK